jgi:hypothetical protein
MLGNAQIRGDPEAQPPQPIVEEAADAAGSCRNATCIITPMT